MKKLIPLLLFFTPFFASGQINMEVYGTVGKTYFTNDLFPENNHIAYGAGMGFLGKLSKEKIQWAVGFQLSTIREKFENHQLRWGTQHDGSGGFDSTTIDPTLATALDFSETMYFVEVPIGIRYFLLDKKCKLFLQPTLGPSFYITTHQDHTLFYPNSDDKKTITNEREEFIRRVNLNGAFSMGVEMPVSGKIKVLVMPQTGLTFFSLGKKSEFEDLQYYFGLRAGIQFEI